MDVSELYVLFVRQEFKLITDSRKIEPGCLYLGLSGEKVDGGIYAEQALQAGASYAIINSGIPGIQENDKIIRVENTLLSLQALAAHHRKQFQIPVIAICGSNGKTTTKELIVACLQTEQNVHFTKGNFNNHIGVPLTLLQMRPEHTISVLEIGANHLKEIEDLCVIARPTHGIITSIGKDHLEGYGSIENAAKSNEELLNYLRMHQGFAWIFQDDFYIVQMNITGLKVLTYGQNTDYTAEISEQYLGGMKVRIQLGKKQESCITNVQLSGRHNLNNILAAAVVAHTFHISLIHICEALSTCSPRNNRSQYIKRGNKEILLDAYNANPSSVEAAIHLIGGFREIKNAVILGDMFELGDFAESEHRKILELALSYPDMKVILAGQWFQKITPDPCPVNLLSFTDAKEIINHATDVLLFLSDRKQILIKGSRGMLMESVLEIFPE